ncbi:MAG TPA: DinB family protein [Actinomycetota bacterium]|nr:DinB family protein [Actinomycetota bacterium]
MTTPSDVLRAMFDHHLWATETLIDHLDRLPTERLDASVPGTYGSMIDTLAHTIDADSRYLLRLRNPTPPIADDRVGVPIAQLRAEMSEHRRMWDEALSDLESGALHAAIRAREDYPDTDPAESMLLIQAIHHGNDHRTQICSTLGALDLELPEIDGWDYWARGRS